MSAAAGRSRAATFGSKFDGGVRPMAIEAGPDGATRRVFVQLSDLHGFAVVDFAQRKEVARIQLPDQYNAYGVEEGIFSGYPCTCSGGEYTIVEGLDLDEFSRARIDATVKELRDEREAVRQLGLI